MDSSTPPGKVRTWAIVESRGQQFAMDVHYLREFVVMPEVTAVPACGARHRGVMNLRGEVLPLLDLRRCLGWQSLPEETEAFNAMMAARERDHVTCLDATGTVTNVFSFADQIRDDPMLLPDLKVFHLECDQFGSAQPTSNQNGQDCSVAFGPQGV